MRSHPGRAVQPRQALLALAEATDCRRVRLLAYFGEKSQPCGNCDNCLQPQCLAELEGIPGLGQEKLEAYGAEVLRVVKG